MKATERQVVIAAALRITMQQARIIELLLANPITTNELLSAVVKHLKVEMHRLREKLKEGDIIDGRRGRAIYMIYGIGYTLGPELREILSDRITKFAQPVAGATSLPPEVVAGHDTPELMVEVAA